MTHWSTVHWVGDAKSLAQVRQQLASGFSWVLYDPEHWAFTPAAEQAHPRAAIRQAEGLAHNHHAHLIVAPALNLVLVDGKSRTLPTAMLTSGIYPATAAAWGVDIQAQGVLTHPAAFAGFVRKAAHQVSAVHPQTTLFVGLSTNPSGHTVTAQQLLAAWNSVRGDVSGFWLNIPSGGTACPRCGVAHPTVAQQFLTRLFRHP